MNGPSHNHRGDFFGATQDIFSKECPYSPPQQTSDLWTGFATWALEEANAGSSSPWSSGIPVQSQLGAISLLPIGSSS